MNPHNKSMLPVGISVKERTDAPGTSAPFALVVDMTVTGKNANGKVFLFNPALKLNHTNTGRGEDLALIYVPSADPSRQAFKQAKQQVHQLEEQFVPLKDVLPKEMLNDFKDNLSSVEKVASSTWKSFLNHPIKPFHLFTLSEQTVISELGYPGQTPYYFPLTTYFIHDAQGVTTFTFKPLGTRRGTNAIFYERVTNLIPGTSGSPVWKLCD